MKFKIFLLPFILLIINSCKSPKTADFRESIIQQERVAFQIILGKEGSETKKLKYLAKNDFTRALAAVDQQTIEFDKIIKNIEILSVQDIKEGDALKLAAINYYRSLKELHYFDRKEIVQQQLINKPSNKDQKMVQNQLVELAREKKYLYAKVYENEHLLSTAFAQFDAANGF